MADISRRPTHSLWVHASRSEGRALKDTKSGKLRRVPLTDEALAIAKRQSAGKQVDALVFTGPRGGMISRQRVIDGAHWGLLGRGRTFHDLRHTAACFWLEAGTSLATVSAWLGHADVTTTARYLHYIGHSVDMVALDKLNAYST